MGRTGTRQRGGWSRDAWADLSRTQVPPLVGLTGHPRNQSLRSKRKGDEPTAAAPARPGGWGTAVSGWPRGPTFTSHAAPAAFPGDRTPAQGCCPPGGRARCPQASCLYDEGPPAALSAFPLRSPVGLSFWGVTLDVSHVVPSSAYAFGSLCSQKQHIFKYEIRNSCMMENLQNTEEHRDTAGSTRESAVHGDPPLPARAVPSGPSGHGRARPRGFAFKPVSADSTCCFRNPLFSSLRRNDTGESSTPVWTGSGGCGLTLARGRGKQHDT